MAYKNKADAQQWYQDNKSTEIMKAKQRKVEYRARNVNVINTLREETPCTDCGVNYPFYVMDFDHVSDDKNNNVITLAFIPCGLYTLYAEIAKCEIVCSNCHRKRTYNRKGDALLAKIKS